MVVGHLPLPCIQSKIRGMTTLTPQAFVAKWRFVQLKERSAYQEHFIDLCRLVGQPAPAEADPAGINYAFEFGAIKQSGGQGFADVFKRGCFALEYKGKHGDLDKAYQQLLQYREALFNPPLLIVCDIDRLVVHTNYTNTAKRLRTITLDDILTADGLRALKAIFESPDFFKSEQTTEQVTRKAAEEFATLAELLRRYGATPPAAAHFLIRCLFCLFAEDAGLLPERLFTQIVEQARRRPETFVPQLQQLFKTMATGGFFGVSEIPYFNGRLFDEAEVLALDSDGLDILARVSVLDWSSIEPSIFGTLFVRSLDPAKRAQLGAQYTSKEDILLILEPVLMAPLRRKWTEIQAQARELAAKRDKASGAARTKAEKQLRDLLIGFATELATITVLDPACGSGNFLYLALVLLLDLWKEVSNFMAELDFPRLLPTPDVCPSPLQLHGIEKDAYAHELAQITIWIGYIQWFIQNGFGFPPEPILKTLDTVVRMDAILMPPLQLPPSNEKQKRSTGGGSAAPSPENRGTPKRGQVVGVGAATEPTWPPADVIVGNPPFLGGKRLRAELGDEYTEALFKLYGDRLPSFIDLCCYWFEKARAMIESGEAKRVGLLATNSIRDGTSRLILERIKQSGNIFWAVSDHEWVLDGAAVNISMIGFDSGVETSYQLDGKPVANINADLSASVDVTQARPLSENKGICFLGMMKAGPFDIDAQTARQMLSAPLNPNGRPNSDVVKRRIGGQEVTGKLQDIWIIDFGVNTPQEVAALYEMPFEYVRKHVKPFRDQNRRERFKLKWWLLGETRSGLRAALSSCARCIITPEVAKHRVFIWMDVEVSPDHTLHVIARDDDYFFGVLHSRLHEIWSLKTGSTLEDRPRYSSSRTFETFPFPWPPGQEPSRGEAFGKDTESIDVPDMAVMQINREQWANASPLQCEQAIAAAARELVQLREAWLNPLPSPPPSNKGDSTGEGAGALPLSTAVSSTGGVGGGPDKRTLTNLYNARPTWLDNAHRKLDEAVFAAYGWPADLSDADLLARLLALNLERAA
jgi:type II restriction/modification system DNA methylase subunit YeeA